MTSPIVANTILSAHPPRTLLSKAWDIHWYSAVLSLIRLHFHSLILRWFHKNIKMKIAEMFKTVGPRGLILTRSGYLLITGGPDVWQKFSNKKVRFRLICTGRDNANIISGSVTVRNWSGNGKLIYRVHSLFINMK